MSRSHGLIRTIYLYIFALVGLFLFVFSTVNLISGALDRYVWPQEFISYDYRQPALLKCTEINCDIKTPTLEQQKEQFTGHQNNNFKRKMNQAIPGVVIGWLLWWFHWSWIKRDRKED